MSFRMKPKVRLKGTSVGLYQVNTLCDSILLKVLKNLIFASLNLLLDSRTFCVAAQEEQTLF